MKEFIFRFSNGCAQLIKGDGSASESALFRPKDEENGTLLLSGKQFSFSANGVILRAKELKSGVYTPVFFVNGKRFEGPPVCIEAAGLFFLPPTHAQICRLEDELQALTASQEELAGRLCAIDAHMQNTNIF